MNHENANLLFYQRDYACHKEKIAIFMGCYAFAHTRTWQA
jgi:hypothetical protein